MLSCCLVWIGGNFLLLPDGRIGLIDYGATKRLSRNERLSTCLLYAALAREDQEVLYTLSEVGGYKSKYGRKDVLFKLIQFGYDSYGKDVTGGKNIQQFIDEMKVADPWEEVPDNLVMAQFMSIRLRSLALGMNHPVKCSNWFGKLAEEQLKREGLPYESWNREQMIKYKPDLNMQKFKFA
jgi:aarF domain-containing kinase